MRTHNCGFPTTQIKVIDVTSIVQAKHTRLVDKTRLVSYWTVLLKMYNCVTCVWHMPYINKKAT